jgi:deazaflavin-dependent oxidoreductase (nitroreductase family)
VGRLGAVSDDRNLSWWERVMEDFAQTRFGGWFAVTIANPIDRRLLKLTRGKVALFVGQPVGLLETTGAKSRQQRETPLLYLDDGPRVILVASNAGSHRHPSWYHNIRANPGVSFLRRGGHTGDYIARIAAGREREELWARVNHLYDGYDAYQGRTDGREIPVVVLDPVETATDVA